MKSTRPFAKSAHLLAITALLLTSITTLPAAETVPPKGFRALFNGTDLTGW